MEDEIAIEWRALNLRLSVFLESARQVEETDWAVLTGEQKLENSVVQGDIKHLWGSALGGNLHLSSQPARIDVIVTPIPSVMPKSLEDLLYIGDFFSSARLFGEATKKWLELRSNGILRLAFGATVMSPHNTLESTDLTIRRLLKSVQVSSSHAKDLSFSVDWLTPSKVFNEAVLNRVTKFSSATFQGQMSLSGSPVMGFQGSFRPAPFPAVRGVTLEVDHSTETDRSEPLPREKIIAIYGELLALAIENVQVGEVPWL